MRLHCGREKRRGPCYGSADWRMQAAATVSTVGALCIVLVVIIVVI